jgi:acyl-CoA thioesterase I
VFVRVLRIGAFCRIEMVLLSTLVMLLASAMAASAPPRALGARPRIVAFGDSLTSGRGIGASRAFPSVLQERLDEEGFQYEVVNAGVAGDTSDRALRRFDDALAGDVRILIVALGANDGLRGVPVARLKANLARIIETAQERGISVLLCGMEALPIYGWDYTVGFHKAYQELADRYGVTLVPFVLRNVIGNPQLMQPDRAHPNADGARVIADNVWPYLKPLVQAPTAK